MDCFISYAKEDMAAAQKLYLDLIAADIDVWMDKPPSPYEDRGLEVGERWEYRLRELISEAEFFLPLFSSVSVEKSGYVQSEFRQALQRLAQIPAGKVFVIPIRLDECTPPTHVVDGISFDQYQWADCFDGDFSRVIGAIARRLNKKVKAPAERKAEGIIAPSEFLAAFVSGADVLLTRSICLTDVADGKVGSAIRKDTFDGHQYEFYGVNGATLRSTGRFAIEVTPRYSHVLTMEASSDVEIHGIRFGHSPNSGSCAGGVLQLKSCRNFTFRDCEFYGCGTYAVELYGSSRVHFENCQFYGCTEGVFRCESTDRVTVSSSSAFGNICYGSGFIFQNSDIHFSDSIFRHNRMREGRYSQGSMFSASGASVILENCLLEENSFLSLGDVTVKASRDNRYHQNSWE